jgi:excisionase family DNA binding protein
MRLMTYQETANRLGLCLSTLYAMVSRGQIPHIRLGPRLVRFDTDEVHAWISARRVEVRPPAPRDAG